ncbi:hypothetical protein WT60_19955 [Burkholderia sp. MSMB617WGS]|uniref:Uncharacterized protein n=1 Tax=Burkholderia savannae TaxID=1637837 RepID=A0ABR5T2P5_9BURK|nr:MULTISPECIES: hypothetical protein [Burkholderia]KVG44847.1 hypothetical protein WS77_06600 [Burkholderia sp. MSMB0265]KVG79661.1 hypothetical protein WS81_14555 [Burkholderia sp. MSMB2040]KVG97079.1 hypothetical protein WS83_31930 [Burkholderia sp. MSMB2042]KVK91050.1 hypothetical protein WS91_25850 [Burkholderia sp. MSMB1498]AOJ72922.1 hypothetical protein WS78_30150 [Burkholderia savannae]
MIAARESVERTLGELLQAYRIARRGEITADIVELATRAMRVRKCSRRDVARLGKAGFAAVELGAYPV